MQRNIEIAIGMWSHLTLYGSSMLISINKALIAAIIPNNNSATVHITDDVRLLRLSNIL